jgi:hypothetical protein
MGGFGYQPYAELKVYSAPEGGKIDSVKDLLQVGEILRASGYKNYQQKLKTLNTHINVATFRELAVSYYNQQILDLIEYGVPLVINTKDFIASREAKKHPSALNFIEHVENYIFT